MKLLNPLKALINLIPIVAIAGLALYLIYDHYAKVALSRPDYDNPEAPYQQPFKTDDKLTQEFRVTKVIDGDSIELETGDQVRFCGIDAPEKRQPLGPESKANLQKLIDQAGGIVMVMQRDRDRYGRIVGEVFVAVPNSQEEKLLNAEQLSSGNAYLYRQYSGNCMNEVVLENAEERAKSQKLGVWKAGVQKPWEFRKATRER